MTRMLPSIPGLLHQPDEGDPVEKATTSGFGVETQRPLQQQAAKTPGDHDLARQVWIVVYVISQAFPGSTF